MELTYLKEITDWEFPSHTYIVNKKMELVGYIIEGTKKEVIFKTPMKNFSKSWRKFDTA